MLISPHVYHDFTVYGCCIAAFLNLIIVPLSVIRSKYSLGSFKIIMLVFAATNMLHYFVDTFSLPRFYTGHKLSLVYVSGRAKDWGGLWATICGVWLCNVFMLQVFLEALHFAYRYILLCQEKLHFLLSTSNVIKILLTSVPIYAALHTANFIYMMPFDEDVLLALENEEYYNLDMKPQELHGIAMLYVKKSPIGEEVTRWRGILAICFLLGCNALLLSTMVFCGFEMHHKIKADWLYEKSKEYFQSFTSASSKRTKEMHHTLFQMLIAQTTTPLILLHTPCTVLLVGPFFVEFGNGADLMMLVVLVYPLVAPMIVIYFLNRTFFRRLYGVLTNKTNYSFASFRPSTVHNSSH